MARVLFFRDIGKPERYTPHRIDHLMTSYGPIIFANQGLSRVKPICACLIILLLANVFGAAAQQKIRFDHITTKQGLSQSTVTCMFQDIQGFMWFGTQDGLNRYDGTSFKVFKHDPANPNTLPENFISSIGEDRHGTLWVATLNNPEIVSRFDRVTETVTRHTRDSVDLKGGSFNSVFISYEDPRGVRWSGSIGGGVTKVEPATGAETTYKHDPSRPGSLSDNRVYSVFGDRSGTIWVGTHEALDRYDSASNEFVHYKHVEGDPNSLSDSWVWPIFEDQGGTLWIGTVRGGLNRFDRATGRFTSYKHDPADPKSLGDDFVMSIFQDRSGLMWVGTSNDGLSTFHPGFATFRHFSNDPANPRSLLDNNIISMYVDRHGTSWIGTRKGLDRLDRSTGEFTHFRPDLSNHRSLADIPNYIYEDRSDVLWIGTYSNGLDRFDRSRGACTHYKNDPSNPNSLSDNRVYALLEDHTGVLWVGTYRGGLNRFDRKTGKFFAYVHSDTVPTSLSNNGIWALCEDHDGVLWVGTSGGGLNKYNRDTETFTVYRHEKGNPASLSDNTIICIYEDHSGTLWVGTTAGLNRFDRVSGTFKQYHEKDGLPNEFIFGVLEDTHGLLWISTNKGLSRFDPTKEEFRNYDVNDGLQGNEFNQNAFTLDHRTGEMYFGGGNGFNIFHPDSVRDNPYVPPIVFSGFQRYNTDFEEGRPINEKGISVRPGITLSYKDNIATFEFAALSYYKSVKNQYAYQLEGFSENWIQLGTDHRATFTNLDAGEYVFRVRGSNNDGVWNNEGTSLNLTVTPPWWKTRWAYFGYVLLVASVLYGARRAEINRREQKAQVRESQLRAKAAEAEKRVLEVENERKTKELEEARQLQLSMLPRELPKLDHLELGVFMKTATEVGGDYYDFSTEADKTLNIGFGDATGHGMQAGTIVTLMKGLFTSDASKLDIQTFMNHCSKSIKDIKLGRLLMAFSLLKIRGNKVSMSSAGMPPAYIYRKNSGAVEEIMLKGMPLGAMKNFPYALHETELDRGDVLLLISDGLPEQKNSAGEMFEYARVQKTFAEVADSAPDQIIKQLVGAVEGWMKGSQQEDDITLLVIRRKSPESLVTN